jgi:hypothetical protein
MLMVKESLQREESWRWSYPISLVCIAVPTTLMARFFYFFLCFLFLGTYLDG